MEAAVESKINVSLSGLPENSWQRRGMAPTDGQERAAAAVVRERHRPRYRASRRRPVLVSDGYAPANRRKASLGRVSGAVQMHSRMLRNGFVLCAFFWCCAMPVAHGGGGGDDGHSKCDEATGHGCVSAVAISTSKMLVSTFLVILGILFERWQEWLVHGAERHTLPIITSLFQELTL